MNNGKLDKQRLFWMKNKIDVLTQLHNMWPVSCTFHQLSNTWKTIRTCVFNWFRSAWVPQNVDRSWRTCMTSCQTFASPSTTSTRRCPSSRLWAVKHQCSCTSSCPPPSRWSAPCTVARCVCCILGLRSAQFFLVWCFWRGTYFFYRV